MLCTHSFAVPCSSAETDVVGTMLLQQRQQGRKLLTVEILISFAKPALVDTECFLDLFGLQREKGVAANGNGTVRLNCPTGFVQL